MNDGPLARLRNNSVQVVSMAVTAVWLGAMFLHRDWWLAALIVGYVFVVPLSKVLAGETEDESDDATDDADPDGDPLETLRRRYAGGELTEAEFERKVERLLATEDRSEAETLLERET